MSFLSERIAAKKTIIIAYEDAITALLAGGVQEYMLDTGQSKQKVTKLDLDALQKSLDSLYNQLVVLEARVNGGGTVIGVPSW